MLWYDAGAMGALAALASPARSSHLDALPGSFINGFSEMESAPHAVDATYIGKTLWVTHEAVLSENFLIVRFLIRLFVVWCLRNAIDRVWHYLICWLPDVAGDGVDEDGRDEAVEPIECVQVFSRRL